MIDNPLFYVSVKDDFNEKVRISRIQPNLPGLKDPYTEVKKHVHSGKVYPVLQVRNDNEFIILDDAGLMFPVNNRLFKYAGNSL